jgi:GNAT superfamily N-acetyltransferase
MHIRLFRDDDDLVALTSMIHAAYAPHAAAGLRYWGTHQTVEDTAKRLRSGIAWVVVDGDDYLGTATLKSPDPASEMLHYRQDDVRILTQFCVHPSAKGRGVGRALHGHVCEHARSDGATRIALDTAMPAHKLIEMYESWGYEKVGTCDWRPHTNYESVVMMKAL